MQKYCNLYLACKQQQLYGPVNYRDFRETVPWREKRRSRKRQTKEITVEPRFNEPLFYEVLGITNCFLQLGQNYSQLNGTEPRLNEPRFNEIIVITNTIQMRNRKIYLDETNKRQHVIKDES